MKPLASLTREHAARLLVFGFDLDDTLLSDGALDADVYAALFALRATGLRLVPVTGRPAGWGQVLARMWPVDALLTENGAIGFFARGTEMVWMDAVEPSTRALRADRVRSLLERIRQQLPEAQLSDDMPFRLSELAFDVAEHRRLPEAQILALMQLIQEHGAWTTRSSVHVHGSFERIDKAQGLLAAARRLLPREVGGDLGSLRHRVVFAGDSGNDVPAFAAFPCSVGVANVRRALRRLPAVPRYVTQAEKGRGFLELAEHLLRLRGG